jgi:hypothetical protein
LVSSRESLTWESLLEAPGRSNPGGHMGPPLRSYVTLAEASGLFLLLALEKSVASP